MAKKNYRFRNARENRTASPSVAAVVVIVLAAGLTGCGDPDDGGGGYFAQHEPSRGVATGR